MNDNPLNNQHETTEQDTVEELRIQRALHGLSPEQFIALNQIADQAGCDESVDEFTAIDRCVAAVDVWLAESDEANKVELTRLQKERVFRQFVGHQEREGSDSGDGKGRGKGRWGGWGLAWVSSAAAVLLTLVSSIVFTASKDKATRTAQEYNQTRSTINSMRQAMIDNPPADMLRWVWTNKGADEPEIKGDVIWSDLLQKGYALLKGNPKHSLNTYELHAFNFEAGNEGVYCGEFHFDAESNLIVMSLSPEYRIERPSRFSVLRRSKEAALDANSSQAIAAWVAEAPDAPFPDDAIVNSAEPTGSVENESLNGEESVTTMQ